MSSIIDSRVVEARFENSDFLTKVRGTLDALSQLQKGLQLTGATKGLADVNTAASRMDLTRIGDGVDRIASKFNAMAVIATAAISRVTFAAVDAGARLAKSFSVGPIVDGFKEYELKLGSTQTILANTARYGTKLKEVNQVLNDLNKYSDKTIYNFGDMTKNIGLFTNAGLRIEAAASMIKGFSNAAAASGTNAEGAAHAAYQLSQALSAGTIRLMDWRSLTNVGMGNKNMQESLIQIADAMGEVESHETSAKEIQGNFNASLEKGWLTAKVMSKYLRIMAGDIDKAGMKQIGLSDSQIKTLQETQKTAEKAATKVRTFTQLMGTLKEAIGSGWAQTFELIFGNFKDATKLFTNVNNVLGGFVNNSSKARKQLLSDWADMGGRKALIDGLSNAFHALLSILRPIRDAFREVFPKKTAEDLVAMTKSFRDFMDSVKIGADTADLLKRSFAGVFAVFSIIGQVISGLVGGIKDLLGVLFGAGEASGGVLDLSASVGDFLVSLNNMLKESGAIKTFFHSLASILAIPLKLIVGLAKMIGSLFTGFDHHGASQVSDALDSVGDKLSPLEAVGKRVMAVFQRLGEFFSNVGSEIADAISHIGDAIASAINPDTFDASLDVINTGLFAAITLMIHNFFKRSAGALRVDFGGGLFKGVTDTLGAATGVLKNMQAQIKADTIMKIAIAMGVLTASLFVLAMIDGKKLAKAFVGVSVGIAGLEVSLAALTKVISFLGALKMPFIVAGLAALGVALLLLSASLLILSTMSWEGILKGLAAMAGMLTAVTVAMQLMPKNPLIVATGAALVLLGAALLEIATAMKIFGSMGWEEIAKGLVATAGALVVITGAIRMMPKTMALQAAGLVLIGLALNPIATAMKIFATMSFMEIARGLVVLAGSLIIIAGAIESMPATMALQAVGLVAVAVALNIIAGAMKIFGTMKWSEIGRGLTVLAGSLALLAAAMYVMQGTMGGSAALLIAASALAIFTPVLITLGNLDWGTIIKGLVTLAATFAVLGIAAALIAPVAPVLLAISAALLLVGAGIALIGAGAFLFATAWGIIVSTTTAGLKMLQELGNTLYKQIPKIMEAFAKGIINIALIIAKGQVEITKAFIAILTAIIDAIAKLAPKIVDLVVNLLNKLLDAAIKLAPKMAKATTVWLDAMLTIVVHYIPKMADAGLKILLGFLEAIDNNIGPIIQKGVDIIKHLIIGIGYGALQLIDTAAKTLIAFLHGLADAIRTYEPQLMAAGWDIAKAIAEGFWNGLKGGLGGMFGKVAGLFGMTGVLGAAYEAVDANSPSREFAKLGRFCAEGFAIGLVGGKDTVLNGLSVITDTLKSTTQSIRSNIQSLHSDMQTLRQDHKDLTKSIQDDNEAVSDATEKLNELQNAKKQDHDAIVQAKRDLRDAKEARDEDTKALKENENQQKETTKELERARKELEATKRASEEFDQQIDKHKQHLKDLGKQYDDLTTQIDAATQALNDKIQQMEQFNEQITQQFSTLPDITEEMDLTTYIDTLTKQISDTQTFIDLLAQAREMGLNDATYQEILSKGVDAIPFVQSILDGGQEAIDTINGLTTQLTDEAKALGATASTELYKAGVDIAAGILKGLKKDQHKIKEQMQEIADDITDAVKKKLKIKSPSEVMAEVGHHILAGIAKGMLEKEDDVLKVVRQIGRHIVETMQKYVDEAMALAATVPDITPVVTSGSKTGTITPIASKLSIVTTAKTAKNASAELTKARVAAKTAASASTSSGNTYISLTQNNTSPKALSTVDIYRQTSNQLSITKEALKNAS